MELVSIEENKNNIVKKHEDLIRNARYRLGEIPLKILSVLISMIKVSDTEIQGYTIKLSDFKELIGSNSSNTYENVHNANRELMRNPFLIEDGMYNWCTRAYYERGKAVITYEIHRDLKVWLLELKNNFLQYNIVNILSLKSGYVIRLYELCKDHYAEGTRYKQSVKSVTFDIKINRLREQFEIPDSYQYSSHIKDRILDKAAKQFKDKTDIQITYKEIKLGRRVDSLHITVKENFKGSNDYLKHRMAFIAYMRLNLINADVLPSKDKITGKTMMISIAPDGKLYDKKGLEFDASRSNDMWDTLFQMAKDETLLCLTRKNHPKYFETSV